MFLANLICLSLGVSLASANVEKTIFLGPEPVNIPNQEPSLSTLNIDTLTPDDSNWSLRTHIGASFPTEESRRGSSSWFILDNLAEGQRYEVRICWLATVSSCLAPPFKSFHTTRLRDTLTPIPPQKPATNSLPP
jgi:hypothetical protein